MSVEERKTEAIRKAERAVSHWEHVSDFAWGTIGEDGAARLCDDVLEVVDDALTAARVRLSALKREEGWRE